MNWEQKAQRLTGVTTAETENPVFANVGVSLHSFTPHSPKHLHPWTLYLLSCFSSPCMTVLLCIDAGFHIKQTILITSDLEIVAGCPDYKTVSPFKVH